MQYEMHYKIYKSEWQTLLKRGKWCGIVKSISFLLIFTAVTMLYEHLVGLIPIKEIQSYQILNFMIHAFGVFISACVTSVFFKFLGVPDVLDTLMNLKSQLKAWRSIKSARCGISYINQENLKKAEKS